MGKKTPAKAVSTDANDINARVEAALAKVKLLNIVQLAEENPMDVETFSTGFPQLDQLLHPTLRGFPCGRDVEVFSPYGQAGKSSLCLQIIAAAQRSGLLPALIEVERTNTDSYMVNLGVVLDRKNPNIAALRILRAQEIGEYLTVEDVLTALQQMANIFDVIVVDSVAALDKKANLEKDSTENTQLGGIAKNLSEFCRKNLVRKATIFWINQMREDSKAYSPSGSTVMKPTGGRALGFYSSVRLELKVIEKVKDGETTIGMKVEIKALKNKMGFPDRKTTLTYLYGMGFSAEWDYTNLGVKMNVIRKSGAWLEFDVPAVPPGAVMMTTGNGEVFGGGSPARKFKVCGLVKFVKALRADQEAFDALKKMVDGEDVAEIEDVDDLGTELDDAAEAA